jgi:ribosomal protein S18 acetylase RimI-like enzyme
MIRLITERTPALAEPLWHDFQTQRFAAVVLETNPQAERARALYRSAILGERFLQEMDRNYEVAGNVGARTVYLPRKPAPANLGNPENLVNPGNPANHD